MNGQRTSQKNFGTLAMFREIGLLIESVRLLLSFQFHLDFLLNIFALIHAADGSYVSSVLWFLCFLEQIPVHSAWTIWFGTCRVSLFTFYNWTDQSRTPKGSIRAAGIGTVLKQARAN